MNLQFLGDALDHWKGSVFAELQHSSLLNDFRVDAMASDSENWEQIDYRLYARLLRVQQAQLVVHKNALSGDRSNYFHEIPSIGDLFLDPDTGFKTGTVRTLSQYLKAAELHDLLKRNKDRVIAVYQHVRARRTRDRVEEVLRVLRNEGSRFFCTSYESGTVALLFFASEPERIEAIREHFCALLHRHAESRIGHWNGNQMV
jgi:hypothetical protein